jgi:hypothetical protein
MVNRKNLNFTVEELELIKKYQKKLEESLGVPVGRSSAVLLAVKRHLKELVK